MSNSKFEHDARNDEAQVETSGRRSNDIRRATEAVPTRAQHSRLAQDRVFGRRAGFIGFSILAHLALLIGIMLNSNLLPSIREVGRDNPRASGGGSSGLEKDTSVALLEMKDASVADANAPDANASVGTAPVESGDSVSVPVAVAVPPPAPVPTGTDQVRERPSSAKTTAPRVPLRSKTATALNSASSAPLSAPAPYAELAALEQVSTEAPSTDAPSTDAPPTLLADPPEELASSDQALDQKLNQVPADQPIDQLPNDQRQIDQPKAPKAEVAPSASEAAPVAAEAGAEDKKRVNEVAASETASTISQGSESENPGIGAGSGVGDLVNGPIRDAGELRALPGNPNPIYPARDRLRRKEGVAVILGQITADGRVGRVVLEKSSGSKEMDLESAKAFRSWRFQAGQAGWVRKPFQFRLVGQAKEVPSPLGGVLKRNSDALGK